MHRFYADFLDRMLELHQDIEKCITGMPPGGLDWSPGEEMNSLAVLVVHTLGAARYWIGDVAAQDPSERDRDAEFRTAGQDEAALKRRIQDTNTYLRDVLEKFTLENLETERLSPRNQKMFTVGWSLLHALDHTALHLGHMELVRQLWDQR